MKYGEQDENLIYFIYIIRGITDSQRSYLKNLYRQLSLQVWKSLYQEENFLFKNTITQMTGGWKRNQKAVSLSDIRVGKQINLH